MKYQAVREHADRYKVSLMCAVLGVSKSGYYDWRDRPESKRTQHNRRLLVHIRASHSRSRCHYGSPRVTQDLREAGERCSEKRVARLMNEHGIRAKRAKKWLATTQSKHQLPIAQNVLNRQFSPQAPNQVWAGDITYLWTDEGWLYLAVVLDLYSRAVIGWSMGMQLTAALASEALQMAIQRRKPGAGLLYHSDRGVQYAAKEYQHLLHHHQITCSMSRKGNCWDNACVESFFSTLKLECVYQQRYRTRDEARGDVFEWMELIYNRQRRHSTLGYRSPAQFEAMAKLA